MTTYGNGLDLTIATKCVRRTITIPGSAGTADTIYSLASMTNEERGNCIGFKICAQLTAGTDRAAFVVGDSTASLLQYVAAATEYYEPVRSDHTFGYVKAVAAGTIAATVVLYMMV